jgi:hypothetical protein
MMHILALLRKNPLTDCTCRHTQDSHEHYRRGSDCAVPTCSCRYFSAQPDPVRLATSAA